MLSRQCQLCQRCALPAWIMSRALLFDALYNACPRRPQGGPVRQAGERPQLFAAESASTAWDCSFVCDGTAPPKVRSRDQRSTNSTVQQAVADQLYSTQCMSPAASAFSWSSIQAQPMAVCGFLDNNAVNVTQPFDFGEPVLSRWERRD